MAEDVKASRGTKRASLDQRWGLTERDTKRLFSEMKLQMRKSDHPL